MIASHCYRRVRYEQVRGSIPHSDPSIADSLNFGSYGAIAVYSEVASNVWTGCSEHTCT